MRVIGVSGKSQAGKTTFAKVAVREFGAIKMAFGDALKEEVAAFLDHSKVQYRFDNLYGGKKDKDELFAIGIDAWFDVIPAACDLSIIPHVTISEDNATMSMSFRTLLQFWGTEYRRKLMGASYWVDQLSCSLRRLPPDSLVVVDDVRFIDEAECIEELFGALVRVDRPGVPQMNHISETGRLPEVGNPD
jgi:hypothetical protein